MSRHRRARAALATLALAVAATGCAPPRPVPLPERATVMQRHAAARSARERLAAGLEASVLIWSRAGGEALPGATGTLWLEAPRGARLTLGSAFGTAFDVAARDDTLEAWVPSRRRGARLDAAAAGLGMAPQQAVVRALAASWTPPGAAWDAAVASDSGWVVRWPERGDTLALVVDADGRPRSMTWHPSGGDTVRVGYGSWITVAGTGWPDRITWSESAHALSVRMRLERVTPRTPSDGRRLRVAMPANAAAVATGRDELETWWRELFEEGR